MGTTDPSRAPRPVRRVDDAERRARLARRHALGPGCRVADPVAAATATVGLHATDPASVFLAAHARSDELAAADVAAALETDRTLVKALVMRRTLFAVSREQLPVVTAVAGPRVAHGERRNLLLDIGRAGAAEALAAADPALRRTVRADPDNAAAAWLDAAAAAVLAALDDGVARTLDELREAVPLVRASVPRGTGRWTAQVGVAPRVLSWLCARGLAVRAEAVGHWRLSRHRWASMDRWLGEPLPRLEAEKAEATLVRWWLERYGPGTTEDVRWWLGNTLTVTRRALAAIGAVPVELADGEPAWLAPGDEAPVEAPGSWVALLPVLDQALMGWKRRDFYVGPHAARVFDAVGNGGPTTWVDGRVVGSWHQDGAGDVQLVPFEALPVATEARLRAAGERVTAFCEGEKVVAPWKPAQP